MDRQTLERGAPIWSILDHQGRTVRWLAQRVSFSESYVRNVKMGILSPSAEFKSRVARALDLPEKYLFFSSGCLAGATAAHITNPPSTYQPNPSRPLAESAANGVGVDAAEER